MIFLFEKMDPFIYISAAIIVAIILFIVSKFRSFREVSSSTDPVPNEDVSDRPRSGPAARIGGESGPRRRVQTRMRVARQQQYSDEEEEEDELQDKIAMPDGKIGAKKRKKLEMKAEKRASREAEESERADKLQRQAAMEDDRKKAEEKQKHEELQKELEEKIRREEEEKRELEEYMKLKESFTVETEGFSGNQTEEETQSLLQEFVNYVKAMKVVILEDLASHFHLKTMEVIDRLQKLQEMEILMGVIDDRGKFICLSMEELQAVATYIKRCGRISISELAENSNVLINLQSSIQPPITAVV